jgi:hypothetical protein
LNARTTASQYDYVSYEFRQVDATLPSGSHESAPWIMRNREGGIAARKPTPRPDRPLDVREDDWSESVRREAAVRQLAAVDVESRPVLDAAALDAVDNMRKARETIEWLDPADRAEELKRLWDITYSLVASEWPGIVRIARILQARRFMEGDAFETEWRSVRSTDAVRRRLEARVGQEIGWRDRLAQSGGRGEGRIGSVGAGGATAGPFLRAIPVGVRASRYHAGRDAASLSSTQMTG